MNAQTKNNRMVTKVQLKDYYEIHNLILWTTLIYKSEFFITIFQVEIQSFLFTETIEDFYHETFPCFVT